MNRSMLDHAQRLQAIGFITQITILLIKLVKRCLQKETLHFVFCGIVIKQVLKLLKYYVTDSFVISFVADLNQFNR